MIDLMERFVEKNRDKIGLARRVKEIEQINKEGKIAFIHAIEGGHAVGKDLENLHRFHTRGVRYMT